MKNYFLIIMAFSLFFVSCSTNEYPTKFSYSPEKPQANSEIEVKYKSEKPSINNADELKMIVYSYDDNLANTEKIAMSKKGEGWIAKYTPIEDINGVILKFTTINGDDDNNELGYVIKMTDKNGNIVKGANAGLASVYNKYSAVLELSAGKDSASKLFELEFAQNPELKREYLAEYINSFTRKNRNGIAFPELEKLESMESFTQKDLEILSNGFKGVGDYRKAEMYYKMIEEKYPTSKLVDSRHYMRFRNMLRSDRMMEVFTEFNQMNSESDLNNYMVSSIISKYMAEKDYSNAQKMFDNYGKYINSNVYNSVAWKLYENDTELDKAVKYCEKGLELARKEVETPSGEKPVYMDETEWKESLKNSLAMILDTYANIQNKLDNKEEALKIFDEAVNLTNKEQPSINENYTLLLHEMGKDDKAKVLIEELIGEGKATDKMRNVLSSIFEKEGGAKEKFEEYVGTFEEKAKEKIIAKLKLEMRNESAPDFELLDLNGEKVKLSDFKGKTVIVDFWATWCGPCLQSFPVIRKAVDKYAENPNVKFLFVNTWERVTDIKGNAEEFMRKSKYPFHVLLDDKNEVVEKFGVQGIPTKFVIGSDGNIKFQSVGFSGVESEVLEELDQMIEMAN